MYKVGHQYVLTKPKGTFIMLDGVYRKKYMFKLLEQNMNTNHQLTHKRSKSSHQSSQQL